MVNTPPYQQRGKCGHFMPQFDSHISCFGCRAKCRGQDPCAQGADATQCAACANLTEEQWSQLRETFNRRSSYRNKASSQPQDETEELDLEPEFTGEDLSRAIDESILDAPENSETLQLPTGISPLSGHFSTPAAPSYLNNC